MKKDKLVGKLQGAFRPDVQVGYYVVCLLSIFVTGEQIRRGLLPWMSLNVLFVLAAAGLLLINRRSLRLGLLGVVLLAAGHSIVVNLVNGCTIRSTLRCLSVYYFPLCLLCIRFGETGADCARIVRWCIRVWNLFVLVMFGLLTVDCLTGGAVIRFLAQHLLYGVGQYVSAHMSFLRNRFPSYMGHFLLTGEIYLIFFVLNISYALRTGSYLLNRWVVLTVSVVGVLSTGSKSCALLLAVPMVALFMRGDKKLPKLLVIVGAVVAAYFVGFFDLIIARLQSAANANYITRGDSWMALLQTRQVYPALLWGRGMDLEAHWRVILQGVGWGSELGYALAKVAVEYPLLTYVFRFGLINTLAVVFVLYIHPAIGLVRTKSYWDLLLLTVIFADVNSYNGLTETMDCMSIYVMFVVILTLIQSIPKQEQPETKEGAA